MNTHDKATTMETPVNRQSTEILLVEDNEADIELTMHALRGENLANDIHIARDGEEALQYIAECQRADDPKRKPLPKLILLDLKLPKVDGVEVLRAVKSNPLTRMIPVVVLTSSKEDPDLVNCYQLGVNSYLQKPVHFEEFRGMVKQLGLYWLLINRLPTPDAILAKAEVLSKT